MIDDRISELTVLGVICDYCDKMKDSNFFYNRKSVIELFKNTSFENIINLIKSCGKTKEYTYAKLAPGNKSYPAVCSYLKKQLNYIVEVIIPLFNEEDYPTDYVNDVTIIWLTSRCE